MRHAEHGKALLPLPLTQKMPPELSRRKHDRLAIRLLDIERSAKPPSFAMQSNCCTHKPAIFLFFLLSFPAAAVFMRGFFVFSGMKRRRRHILTVPPKKEGYTND
jgi:hypothetical protein